MVGGCSGPTSKRDTLNGHACLEEASKEGTTEDALLGSSSTEDALLGSSSGKRDYSIGGLL